MMLYVVNAKLNEALLAVLTVLNVIYMCQSVADPMVWDLEKGGGMWQNIIHVFPSTSFFTSPFPRILPALEYF